MKVANNITDLWEAIKTTMLEIQPTEVKKNMIKSMDNRPLLLRTVTILKCKGFKDLSYKFICFIIGIDNDLITFLLK